MYEGVYTPIDPDSAGAMCTPEAAPVLDDHGQLARPVHGERRRSEHRPRRFPATAARGVDPGDRRGDHDDRVVHDHARHDHDGGADDGGAGDGRRRLSTATDGASGGCRAPRRRSRHHDAADHRTERQLLAALRRDHRPPLRLGALDVGLLVGDRRRPALAFSRSLATSHGQRV